MIHYIVLCKLAENVGSDRLDDLVRSARSQLLQIPSVLQVRAGKRIDDANDWEFFYSVDCESKDKFAMYREDPIQVKFFESLVRPSTGERMELLYELEPGKDIRYS